MALTELLGRLWVYLSARRCAAVYGPLWTPFVVTARVLFLIGHEALDVDGRLAKLKEQSEQEER